MRGYCAHYYNQRMAVTHDSYKRLQDLDDITRRLLAEADKPSLENALRLIALRLGYQQRRHGQVDLTADVPDLLSGSISEEQLLDLTEGLEVLAEVLAGDGGASSASMAIASR